MKKAVVLFIALLLLLGFQTAFAGSKEKAAQKESESTSAETKAPSKTVETKRGGVLKVGIQPLNNLDPHFATSISDILVSQQLYDGLVFIDKNNRPVPNLATKWESPDGKVWTFTVRTDAKFSNGDPITVDDIIYSFNRLRDPKIGAPTVKLYRNIVEIKAPDASHVQFILDKPNPEFPSDVGDYHAVIISKKVKDPSKEWINSGPFVVKNYSPEDRIVLGRNPYYWEKGDDGKPLPYIDELQFIFSPDLEGKVEALRGGQLNFVGGLSAQFVEIVKRDPNLKLLTNVSNMHYVLHMRSDKGHVASDNRVRMALKLATNHREIIDAVRPGLAEVGNGFTPVGPAYKDYYLNKPPKPDIEKAKKLLAEAGYPNGLKITLYAQNAMDVPNIATVWKEQMAKIGVDVEINVIPTDIYYGNGEQSWLKCDFGITDWGARATPVTYFKLAYTSDAPWNESHWSDPEFDELVKKIDSEMDKAKRIELYKKAQEILIERGPIIVPYFEDITAAVTADVSGITIPSDWARTRFYKAYFEKR